MAAVLCLMFLPLVICSPFMIGSMGDSMSIGVLLAGATFLLLAGGLVVGALRLSRTWEAEELD